MSIGHPGVALKSVWDSFTLLLVAPDADSTGRATFRVLRLPTPGDNAVFDMPDPPAGGARQVRIGTGSKESYGWPVIETNAAGDAVIAYTRVGPGSYASIRYNAWLDIHPAFEPEMLFGRILKAGEATVKQNKDASSNPKPTRWGDLAGASVDMVAGKEADGIWIAHEYALATAANSTVNGSWALWFGKIFGSAYPDWYFSDDVLKVAGSGLRQGSSATLKAKLANGGDRAARRSKLRAVLVDADGREPTLASAPAPQLPPGRSRSVELSARIPSDLAPGSYGIKLVVDPPGRAREYSRQNNSIACACAVVVPGAPPPVPPPTPAPTPPPAPPTAPSSPPDLVLVRLSPTGFTVVNSGGTDAGPFEVTVSNVGAFPFGGLSAGAAASREFTSPCSRTVRTVQATADPRLQVTEANESNNDAMADCS